MRAILFYAMLFTTISLNAQVWLSESFNTTTFPPYFRKVGIGEKTLHTK